MRRCQRFNSESNLSSVFQVRLGGDVSESFCWRAQLASLRCLQPSSNGLQPTSFTATARGAWEKRHRHIAQLSPSPDGGLLAVASSDAVVEVHEPGDRTGESLRLTLEPVHDRMPRTNLKFSGAAWLAPAGAESVVMAFENLPQMWLFDLQTCSLDRPTTKIRLASTTTQRNSIDAGVSDVARVDDYCFAVSLYSGMIQVYDVRASHRKNDGIATLCATGRFSVIDTQGMYIYRSGGDSIHMHDRRMLRPIQVGSIKSFGGRHSSAGGEQEVASVTIGNDEDRRPSFLKALPGAAPGCVMYQTSGGAVGHVDMAASRHALEHIPEESITLKRPRPIETGLDEYGTASEMMHQPWHVRRRHCDVKVGPLGQGWRVVAPIAHGAGVRVITFGPGVKTRSMRLWRKGYYSCVHAINSQFDKFILGGSDCTLETIEASF